jgi:CBS domain-containing protein
MSTKVVSAAPEDEIQKVYAMILESGFTTFPVVIRKRLAGIISRRDLISARKVRSAIAQHNQARIETVMTRNVFTIGPEEPISTAAGLIVAHDVSMLPVMDGDRMVGVINRHDVLRALA